MKVLVAHPDAALLDAATRAIERFGYRCQAARDDAQVWAAIQAEEPSVLLAGLDLPSADGTELYRRVRDRQGAGGYCYLVTLAPADDPEALFAAMSAGADDFLTLPLDAEQLHARLQVAERFVMLYRQLGDQQGELDRAGRALRARARTDALTQLWNRIQLNDDLDLFQGQLRRYGHRYAAAILDLDRFRAYNETYGQLAGDEALRVVAATIAHQLRTGDRAYRFGGDELVVLLPEQTPASARIAVERIREAVDALALQHLGNPPWNLLTVSAGVAAFRPNEQATYDALLARAEAALQRAKEFGGNRVAFEDGPGDGDDA